MKVYTNSTEGVDITPGKFYDFTPVRDIPKHNEKGDIIGYITDDSGVQIIIRPSGCFHLRGDKWHFV